MNLSPLFSILNKEFDNLDLRYAIYDRCKDVKLREYEIREITHNLLVVSSAIVENIYQCNLDGHDNSYTIPKNYMIRLFLTGDQIPVGDKYVEVIKTKKDSKNTVSLRFSKISKSFLRVEDHIRMQSIANVNNLFIDKIIKSPKIYREHQITTLLEEADSVSNGLVKIDNELLFLYYYRNIPVIYPFGEYKGEI